MPESGTDSHVKTSVTVLDALIDGSLELGFGGHVELLEVSLTTELSDHCVAHQRKSGKGCVSGPETSVALGNGEALTLVSCT